MKIFIIDAIPKNLDEDEKKPEIIIDEMPKNKRQLLRINYTLREDSEECGICLVTYNEKDKLIYLPCLHYFHENCILEWINKSEIKGIIPEIGRAHV